MRRQAVLAVLLAAAPRAQAALPRVILEGAPVTASAGSAAASIVAPSLSPVLAPPALAPPAFAPEPAAYSPDAPAPVSVEAAEEPRHWNFGDWSLPKEDASGWTFRDS